MLPDELFDPLDLDDALEAAGSREAGIALLKDALDDPRAQGDPAYLDYLDELIDQLTEIERFDEAIAATYRMIELDESSRLEELGSIAYLHARNGDHRRARALLDELRGQGQPLDDLMNTLVLANELQDLRTARAWLEEDLQRGVAEGWDPDLLRVHRGHYRRIGGDHPWLEELVEQYLAEHGPVQEAGEQPVTSENTRYIYPGTDKLEIERGMRADRKARIFTPEGQAVKWPPNRNDACWCGSGEKYKKCCGRP